MRLFILFFIYAWAVIRLFQKQITGEIIKRFAWNDDMKCLLYNFLVKHTLEIWNCSKRIRHFSYLKETLSICISTFEFYKNNNSWYTAVKAQNYFIGFSVKSATIYSTSINNENNVSFLTFSNIENFCFIISICPSPFIHIIQKQSKFG